MEGATLTHINDTPGVPAAIGSYSQATVINFGSFKMLTSAGLIALHPETGEVVSQDVEE